MHAGFNPGDGGGGGQIKDSICEGKVNQVHGKKALIILYK